MSQPPLPPVESWLKRLQNNAASNQQDDPNYCASTPQSLITTSNPLKFTVGTGAQIFSSVLPTCFKTNQEVIIVTCFWAKSTSQDAIASMLRKLSAKAISKGHKIQVRICFSSRSITQKLFQTSSVDGKNYPPSTWISLGLPNPEELEGLNMVVKSVFVRPFSVMHPKFILVDRKTAFMPSCNVSWESWFEGCIELNGGICEQLFDFWSHFWSRGRAELPTIPSITVSDLEPAQIEATASSLMSSVSFKTGTPIPTILLPSPHHINPRFRPFSNSTPPPTPLNIFLLEALTSATSTIFMQTPNLTSRPVIKALFAALERGVSITLITSSRLMILEQIVTAGTITELEVWKLQRRYRRLLSKYENTSTDSESQLLKPGALKIGYYHPRAGVLNEDEPVKSHLKLTIIDDEVVVLGSGNMDRASWYTSQELGIALFGKSTAEMIRKSVLEDSLGGRVSYV